MKPEPVSQYPSWLTVRLEEELDAYLKRSAQLSGQTVSWVVRRLLDLGRKQAQKKRLFSGMSARRNGT